MMHSKADLWLRFQKYYTEYPKLGLTLDLSRMNFPDEKRMVGHYWLRNPALAPKPSIRKEIEETIAAIHAFSTQVHDGTVRGATGPFRNLLLIGIGGPALGP